MNNLLLYSGITTKIKAMEAHIITKSDYVKIASLESTAEFIAFLKNHPRYNIIFGSLDEHQIHRGQAEDLFINALCLDFSKIYRFATIDQRKDLYFFFFRNEINILKSIIQSIYNGDRYDLSLFRTFFKEHSKLNLNALSSSLTMEDYVNNLKGTEYYSLFLMLQNTNHTTPFDYEMQLDIYYFKKVWQLKDKLLKGDNLKSATISIGTEIDLLNIMWLYRSKKFFSSTFFSSTFFASYDFIIPISYKLTKTQLTKLVEAATIDELIAVLKSTHYENICTALTDGTIEAACHMIISKVYQDNKTNYPSSMAPVNNYLYQKQSEINRLTTALECIRYKLEPQDTLRYVL